MDLFVRTTDTLIFLNYSTAKFCRPWYDTHNYHLSGATSNNSRESKLTLGWKLVAEDALTKWED